jgi:hypothetical protein
MITKIKVVPDQRLLLERLHQRLAAGLLTLGV